VESSLIAKNKSLANLRPWQPGQSGNPAGRPKRATEEAYLNAILKAMPPEKLADLIMRMSERAEWRAQAWAGEIAAHYGLGKPVQRIETGDNGLQHILAVIDGRTE
jgi:hypothetical protein